MTTLFVQYLAICNNKNCPSRFKILPNTYLTLKKLPNLLKSYQSCKARHIWSHWSKVLPRGHQIVRIHWSGWWEPWSSGCGKRLVFKWSWVWIPVPYTGWTFFHIHICCKICNVFEKTKNKKRPGLAHLIINSLNVTTQQFSLQRALFLWAQFFLLCSPGLSSRSTEGRSRCWSQWPSRWSPSPFWQRRKFTKFPQLWLPREPWWASLSASPCPRQLFT